MIKVRFNLGKGENFMKWQIKTLEGVSYHNPDDVILVMNTAKLVNHPETAKKIFDGANKTVCAWIQCQSIRVFDKGLEPTHIHVTDHLQIKYNPRVEPHWKFKGVNVDKATFSTIISRGNKLFSQTENKS